MECMLGLLELLVALNLSFLLGGLVGMALREARKPASLKASPVSA